MATHSEAIHLGGTRQAFVGVWFGLLVLTAIEVLLAYLQVTPVLMLVALVGLSVVKAALIIAYFMHLKFERLSLFLTLFPMLVICILLLLILFLPDSARLMELRPR